jgi:hypothetical protein
VACPRYPCVRRVLSLRSPLTPGDLRLLVRCCEEPCVDQQADRPPPHGIHGICPAPLVTETADTRIVIGLEGRGNTGLPHRLSHLHVDVHAVCPPRKHAPHRQLCRTEGPRTRSAGSPAASAPSSHGVRPPSRAPFVTAPVSGHAQRPARQSADALPLADPSRPVQTRTLPSLAPSFRGKGRQEFMHPHSHSKKPEKNGNYCVKKRGVSPGKPLWVRLQSVRVWSIFSMTRLLYV